MKTRSGFIHTLFGSGKSLVFLLVISLVTLAWKPEISGISQLKMEMESYSLHKGKKVGIKGEVFFRQNGSLLVTHTTFPSEKITKTNGLGEYYEYDFKRNTIIHLMGKEYSSRISVFHAFFNGGINDMGLNENGFVLKKTRIEKRMVITTWEPLAKESKISRAELVHENHLPIYLAFYDLKNKPLQKAFYSDYQSIGAFRFPFSLTEFEYPGESDSIITRKKYRNPIINEAVDQKWFSFQVPSSARIIKPGK